MDKKLYPMEITKEAARDFGFEEKDLVYTKIGKRKALCILVPVTEEQYDILMRPIWKEDKRLERERNKQMSKEREVLSLECLREEFTQDFTSNYDLEAELISRENLNNILSTLNEKDRKIIEMFLVGMNESEIGKKIGLSQTAVSKRKRVVFKNLKIFLNFGAKNS